MTTKATGTLEIKNWDEKPYDEVEGAPKMTRALISTTYKGDIEGEATLEYLMVYRTTNAYYVGLERVVGKLGGRSGSFVLQHSGVFENGKADTTSFVVPGSGAGELEGLKGEGGYVSDDSIPVYTLNYEFE